MLNFLVALLRVSIVQPTVGATTVLGYRLPTRTVFEMATLIVILGSILSYISLLSLDGEPEQSSFFTQPIPVALTQGALLALFILSTFFIGRMAGGRGDLSQTFLLIVWLQFIMLIYQAIQTVALFLMPGLEIPLNILSVPLFFWLFVNFVKALHSFRSGFKVLIGIVAAMIAVAVVLVTIASFFSMFGEV